MSSPVTREGYPFKLQMKKFQKDIAARVDGLPCRARKNAEMLDG